MDWGRQASADLGSDSKSGVWGGEYGRKGLLRKVKDGVLGSGCLGLSIPLLPSEVLCRLVFFFFIIEIRAGAGEQGKGLGRGCSQVWGSLGSPSQLRGWHRAPWQAFNKLLVILTDPRTHAFQAVH